MENEQLSNNAHLLHTCTEDIKIHVEVKIEVIICLHGLFIGQLFGAS